MIAAANPKIYILILHIHITPHAHCTSLFSHTEQYDAMKTCTELATRWNEMRKMLIWRMSQMRSNEKEQMVRLNNIGSRTSHLAESVKCTCVQNRLHTCRISFTIWRVFLISTNCPAIFWKQKTKNSFVPVLMTSYAIHLNPLDFESVRSWPKMAVILARKISTLTVCLCTLAPHAVRSKFKVNWQVIVRRIKHGHVSTLHRQVHCVVFCKLRSTRFPCSRVLCWCQCSQLTQHTVTRSRSSIIEYAARCFTYERPITLILAKTRESNHNQFTERTKRE